MKDLCICMAKDETNIEEVIGFVRHIRAAKKCFTVPNKENKNEYKIKLVDPTEEGMKSIKRLYKFYYAEEP